MKLFMKLFFVAALLTIVAFLAGCSALKALVAATGFQWEFSESSFEQETGVQTPYDWKFLFGVNMSADQAELLNGSFSVNLSILEQAGFSLPNIQNQIIAAHAAPTPSGSPGLRYANKILFQNQTVMMDGDAIAKLGDSVGASGAGWYGVYYTEEAVGFLKGTIKNCNGSVPQNQEITVHLSDGPFWTYASPTDGSWALPSINDKPAAIGFNSSDCAGTSTAPVTDTTNNPDPKQGAVPTVMPNTPLNDKTNVVNVGNLSLQDFGAKTNTSKPTDLAKYEFNDDYNNWTFTGNYGECFKMFNDAPSYNLMFPNGTNTAPTYGLISTGWSDVGGKTTCTLSRTFTVPAGATNMLISYDFLSQEYPVYVGSAYNDIFTVMVQGDTQYAVHRTINGDNNWQNFDNTTTPPQGQIGWIASSADAQYNTQTDPGDPHVFNGHLVWTNVANTTPRGNNDSNLLTGLTATYPVTAGATITVLFTVSDTADAIYDSAAALEYVAFQ
jgi:hypothetical protein